MVEVALPAAGFKLFITSGHQLNTRVKQKMLKVYVLGAAVVFLTCPTGKRVLGKLPLPLRQT